MLAKTLIVGPLVAAGALAWPFFHPLPTTWTRPTITRPEDQRLGSTSLKERPRRLLLRPPPTAGSRSGVEMGYDQKGPIGC